MDNIGINNPKIGFIPKDNLDNTNGGITGSVHQTFEPVVSWQEKINLQHFLKGSIKL